MRIKNCDDNNFFDVEITATSYRKLEKLYRREGGASFSLMCDYSCNTTLLARVLFHHEIHSIPFFSVVGGEIA